MGHIDASTAVRMPARSRTGYWYLRYHAVADELWLHDEGGTIVAGLTDASEHVARMVQAIDGGGPIGVRIPAIEPGSPWTILLLPGSNEIALSSPLGDVVGGTDDAASLVRTIADEIVDAARAPGRPR